MAVKMRDEQLYNQLIESAKKIGQLAEKEALQADQDATISQNVIHAIIEAGINRLILPKDYGYPQIDFTTFADIVKSVGYYNLSAAWLTYFYSLHNAWAALLPKHRMNEIVNDGGLLADIFAPVGKVVRVDGGFLLSGKWNYVSGVNYSTWISLGALYQYEGEGSPELLGLCMKVSELTIIEDWDTMGLRGSGSNTVIAENVFVPDDMVIRLKKTALNRKPLFEFEVDEDYLYYNVPFFSAFYIGFPAMALGAAERVLHEFKERSLKRVRLYGTKESETAKPQRVLAELTLKFKSSIGLMKEYIHMLETDFRQYDPSEYLAIRAVIIQNCVEIAVKVILTLGASALLKDNKIEMIARDLMAIGTHVTSLYEDGIEAYGKHLFGYSNNVLG